MPVPGVDSPPSAWPDLGPGRLAPRERVRTALAHREPDRVPVDLWAVPEVWQRLQAHLGGVTRAEVLRRLRVDVRWVAPRYVGPERELPGGISVDPYGMWRKRQDHGYGAYEEYAGYPLADARSAADIAAWDGPRSEHWDVSELPRELAELDAEDEYFVCYDLGGIFERSWGLVGLERFLTDLTLDPEVPCAIMDRITDLYIANVRRVLQAAQGRIDMVYTWDDVAHQHGLLLSPALWRQCILPRHRRLNDAIRAFGVRIMYHSCGAISPLIPALIDELGIDVLNPLQPCADGMDLTRIKEEFGGRVAFHGGVDIQHTLPHGTPQEVSAEVRERCRVLGRGGGYVLAAAHYIQNDTPTENILAMFRTPRTAK
ncbi:MAG TPA: uroporphyrinogen decarboxylase family protein [Anaerolineae bacterium]|nr:uroporphyrinogen decarboxylase family protein [Anaerolineae bacterium]